LAGSAFATLVSSAIVLVDDRDIKDVTTNYTSEKFQQIKNVYIFGLQGAVNDQALYQTAEVEQEPANDSGSDSIL